jgi:uncharacterized protein (DUF488 family)
MIKTVYTIGHSTHSIETFIGLLKAHAITALCDVRSSPYSRMNPQFNRETLKQSLKEANIKYVFLGKELGARSQDKSCYRHGQVRYDLLAQTELFQQGIRRIEEGAQAYRLALMCAEKEPLDCHRTILVSRRLVDDGLAVKHILYDGKIEDHADAIERLICLLKVPTADMFRGHDAVIRTAYEQQANSIAYREETSISDR